MSVDAYQTMHRSVRCDCLHSQKRKRIRIRQSAANVGNAGISERGGGGGGGGGALLSLCNSGGVFRNIPPGVPNYPQYRVE